jgi:hypothetical protein
MASRAVDETSPMTMPFGRRPKRASALMNGGPTIANSTCMAYTGFWIGDDDGSIFGP